ncbi:hypothetical protein AB0K14_15610 [Actinosynnema sp. NPDC050801]|uniref:hypothetical protein n=1 Tax=unclassified Actinosynnema TaxID=2637065 RepID=UPI0033FEB059
MRRLLVTMLALMFTVPGVASASGVLHSCTTSVDGHTASGQCEGGGSFRLLASCEDGSTARSSWLNFTNGIGKTKIRCRSNALEAWIEQR